LFGVSRRGILAAMARLLIVDDNPELADNIAEILAGCGHEAQVVDSVEAALDLLRSETFAGILTDLRLPGQSGLDLIALLRERVDATPVVLMTAFADEAAAQTARRLGALEVLLKPLELARLFSLVEEVVRTASSETG
jgi:DNA-binding NtrC family response regulator